MIRIVAARPEKVQLARERVLEMADFRGEILKIAGALIGPGAMPVRA